MGLTYKGREEVDGRIWLRRCLVCGAWQPDQSPDSSVCNNCKGELVSYQVLHDFGCLGFRYGCACPRCLARDEVLHPGDEEQRLRWLGLQR